MQTTQGQDLRSVGITPGGLEADVETGEEMSQMEPAGAMPGSAEVAGVAPGAAPGAAPPAV